MNEFTLSRLCAFVLVVFLSPILGAVAVLVRLTLGRPIFFFQERAGREGRPFQIIKFRTMRLGTAPDHERITAFGCFMRRTSLDELPSLWNVVRGEMSFVGPRPLPIAYVPAYTSRQRLRLSVKPGLTGWAQINGRNRLTWHERLELDAWYVEHRSTRLDALILWRTIGTLFHARDISHVGHTTMPAFIPLNEDQLDYLRDPRPTSPRSDQQE